jgi:hypothetical protein
MDKEEAFSRLSKTAGLLDVQNVFLNVWVGEKKEDDR